MTQPENGKGMVNAGTGCQPTAYIRAFFRALEETPYRLKRLPLTLSGAIRMPAIFMPPGRFKLVYHLLGAGSAQEIAWITPMACRLARPAVHDLQPSRLWVPHETWVPSTPCCAKSGYGTVRARGNHHSIATPWRVNSRAYFQIVTAWMVMVVSAFHFRPLKSCTLPCRSSTLERAGR